tara:strand:- start:914 stop:1129 length:216 start_codon:yes stop_codon:yes gene_type:complete
MSKNRGDVVVEAICNSQQREAMQQAKDEATKEMLEQDMPAQDILRNMYNIDKFIKRANEIYRDNVDNSLRG